MSNITSYDDMFMMNNFKRIETKSYVFVISLCKYRSETNLQLSRKVDSQLGLKSI